MKSKFINIFSLIFLGTTAVSLIACGGDNSNKKVCLDYGTIRSEKLDTITSLKELEYDDLTSKISHKDSFLLAIYNSTCGCWKDFQPVLTEFINDTNCDVSYINVNKFLDKDSLGLYLVKGDMPSLAVFQRGKLVIQSVYLKDDRMMFKDYSHFKKFIDENVILPKMYYIDKPLLDSYISNNKDMTLYIGRNGCPDCTALERDVFHSWIDANETSKEPLYVFDIQEYYASSWAGSSDEEIANYQLIKDTYGLSEVLNPDLGYGTGCVPTLQRRKGATITDMVVTLNDSLNSETRTISSYFTSSRIEKMPFLQGSEYKTVLDGMVLSEEQATNWRSSYKETYNQTYHYPVAALFLDTYLK